MLKYIRLITISFAVISSSGCETGTENHKGDCINHDFFSQYSSRNFQMGFSTWAYAPDLESVQNTYNFLAEYGDIYSEHIDSNIPWQAWMNNSSLPEAFVNEIEGRKSRKIANTQLTVSVSLLNNARNELAPDFDGTVPDHEKLNDAHIEDAYVKHIQYIVNQLEPDYLVIAIEVNELLIHSLSKWEQYKSLMNVVKPRIRQLFPDLLISESVTLHNLYQPDVPNSAEFIQEIVQYVNGLDFAAISFYPFFKGLNDTESFQQAFDFLHDHITIPVAFAETSHLSENLEVESFSLSIPGDQCEQNAYLEVLFTNARKHDYHYVIWWAHRDYDALWQTFPPEVQDLGKLWISTGIINEDGNAKKSLETWNLVFSK